MKKILLTLGAALLLSAGVFAQTTEADPTSSELSGNDATSTNNGYAFNFLLPIGGYDASVVNCTSGRGIINQAGSSTAYGFSYNAESIYAVFSFDGTQGVTGFLWNRLPSGNCTPTTVDIKGTTIKLKAKVRSTVEVPEFYIGVVVNQDGQAVLADEKLGTGGVKLEANTWTTVEFDIATKGWYSGGYNDVDLDKTIGIFLTARDAKADPQTSPNGEIAIDWITFGDADGTEKDDRIVALTDAEIAALDVKVFPNPASDVVNVSYNVPADEQVTVTLSNSLGQAVASVEGSTSSASIDVAGLNGGLYFASVVVDGIVVATQKVIVE